MNYGLQLYSIRDITPNDLKGALESVAALGYKTVEFAGFFGHPAETVKGWLDELGLTISGTHTRMEALQNEFDETVAYHKAIGCSLLIIPAARPKTQEELADVIAKINQYQADLAPHGITLSYHNHAHEFPPIENGGNIWDALLKQTTIPLEIDTYWAYVGGQDPLALMDLMHAQNRLSVIHIKDGTADGKGTPLGLGTAPVQAVYRKAKELGVPMVVESETLTPSGLEEAKICIEFLKKMENN